MEIPAVFQGQEVQILFDQLQCIPSRQRRNWNKESHLNLFVFKESSQRNFPSTLKTRCRQRRGIGRAARDVAPGDWPCDLPYPREKVRDIRAIRYECWLTFLSCRMFNGLSCGDAEICITQKNALCLINFK